MMATGKLIIKIEADDSAVRRALKLLAMRFWLYTLPLGFFDGNMIRRGFKIDPQCY